MILSKEQVMDGLKDYTSITKNEKARKCIEEMLAGKNAKIKRLLYMLEFDEFILNRVEGLLKKLKKEQVKGIGNLTRELEDALDTETVSIKAKSYDYVDEEDLPTIEQATRLNEALSN